MAMLRDAALNELVERAVGGDKAAFSRIVRSMMKPVVALTYRMTQDRESAIDLAQDAFVAAWENLRSFRGEGKFESWLFAIASKKTLNFLKQKAVRRSEDLHEDEIELTAEGNPETELATKSLREDVLAFVKLLPPRQRLAFNLRFYQQMPFNEIARVSGAAVGTVKTNYREAVRKLRDFALRKGWR